jgi:beta-glucosidase
MQKGVVGINVYSYWSYPLTNSTVDLEATQRCKDFLFGWYDILPPFCHCKHFTYIIHAFLDFKCGTDRILEPLVFGDYPEVMRKNVGSRLPHFNKNQSERIKGSLNFIGINHYYSLYVNDRPLGEGVRDYTADMSVYSRGTYGFLYSEVSSHS